MSIFKILAASLCWKMLGAHEGRPESHSHILWHGAWPEGNGGLLWVRRHLLFFRLFPEVLQFS